MFLSLFLLIWRGGGARARATNGGVSDDPASDLRAFWRATSDPARGRGTQADQPPPPRLQSSSKPPSRAFLPHKNIFLEYSVLSTARAIRRGGGGAWQNLTPSPQAEITIATPITRAPTHLLKSPKLATGYQPRPPHGRPSHPPRPCSLHRDILVFI
jgi:hypothetical protein